MGAVTALMEASGPEGARGSDSAILRHPPEEGAAEKEPRKIWKVSLLWCELRKEGSGKQARPERKAKTGGELGRSGTGVCWEADQGAWS